MLVHQKSQVMSAQSEHTHIVDQLPCDILTAIVGELHTSDLDLIVSHVVESHLVGMRLVAKDLQKTLNQKGSG